MAKEWIMVVRLTFIDFVGRQEVVACTWTIFLLSATGGGHVPPYTIQGGRLQGLTVQKCLPGEVRGTGIRRRLKLRKWHQGPVEVIHPADNATHALPNRRLELLTALVDTQIYTTVAMNICTSLS